MPEENGHKVLTKTAYEHLVAAVGQMLEEGKNMPASGQYPGQDLSWKDILRKRGQKGVKS